MKPSSTRKAFKRLVGVDYEEFEEFDRGFNSYLIGIIIMAIISIGIFFIVTTTSYETTASWYGTTGDHYDPFKHLRTADGHRFDENALTAASWMYPIGSHVRVTNKANGRFIVVTITDRGPGRHLYKHGRIIDLSRGSFIKIADLKEGVIRVNVKRI